MDVFRVGGSGLANAHGRDVHRVTLLQAGTALGVADAGDGAAVAEFDLVGRIRRHQAVGVEGIAEAQHELAIGLPPAELRPGAGHGLRAAVRKAGAKGPDGARAAQGDAAVANLDEAAVLGDEGVGLGHVHRVTDRTAGDVPGRRRHDVAVLALCQVTALVGDPADAPRMGDEPDTLARVDVVALAGGVLDVLLGHQVVVLARDLHDAPGGAAGDALGGGLGDQPGVLPNA